MIRINGTKEAAIFLNENEPFAIILLSLSLHLLFSFSSFGPQQTLACAFSDVSF